VAQTIEETRRALGRLMTEFLGGPHAESLEKRMEAVLTARIFKWEAAAVEKQAAINLVDHGKVGDRWPEEQTQDQADTAAPNSTPPIGKAKLNVGLVRQWITDEGYDNKELATVLKISVRAVSSLRNNGNSHGDDAVTRLANLMKRDVELLDCGIRPEECFPLRWENHQNGVIEITRGKTDNARRRIRLSQRVQSMLEMRRGGVEGPWIFPRSARSGHIEPSSLQGQHAKACTIAKVEHFRSTRSGIRA
jgi:hypothetical protein